MLNSIVRLYGLADDKCTIQPFGNGLINNTWLVHCSKERFILQGINDEVFTSPQFIADNLHQLGQFFQHHFPDYLFAKPLTTLQNEELVFIPGNGYFRMFQFIDGSFTYDTVTDTHIAFEAARAFGKFTRLLTGFDIARLHATLPDFHNLTLRYQQFTQALVKGNQQRIADCETAINENIAQKNIVDIFNTIKTNPNFKQRVTHHDTKISNVLFGNEGNGLCVIDLDTVMPGYFISDVGDMMRTYLSPVSEEEKDFSKIVIREEYFDAIADGYLSEMKDELSDEEKHYFVYAGKFMIYMQAIRFLTDHINNDIYYGVKYEGHNLIRSKNQLELLKQLIGKEEMLQAKVSLYIKNTLSLTHYNGDGA